MLWKLHGATAEGLKSHRLNTPGLNHGHPTQRVHFRAHNKKTHTHNSAFSTNHAQHFLLGRPGQIFLISDCYSTSSHEAFCSPVSYTPKPSRSFTTNCRSPCELRPRLHHVFQWKHKAFPTFWACAYTTLKTHCSRLECIYSHWVWFHDKNSPQLKLVAQHENDTISVFLWF